MTWGNGLQGHPVRKVVLHDPANVVRAADVIVDALAASHLILDDLGMEKVWNKFFEPVKNEV